MIIARNGVGTGIFAIDHAALPETVANLVVDRKP